MSAGRWTFRTGRRKFDLARTVTAILGTLVLDQGDAAGVLAVDERAHYVPPRSGHHHLRVFLAELAVARRPGAVRRSARRLRRAATIVKRRGLVLVISDLYEDEAALAADPAASRGWDTT